MICAPILFIAQYHAKLNGFILASIFVMNFVQANMCECRCVKKHIASFLAENRYFVVRKYIFIIRRNLMVLIFLACKKYQWRTLIFTLTKKFSECG